MNKSLLPPKATPLERAIEDVSARLGSVPSPIGELWDPEKCPVEYLPWLAWSLSLDAWKPYWPESVKRQRIKDAIQIQLRKGTARSVRDVVESFGSAIALREWFQKDPIGIPHSFDVVLTLGAGVPNTAKFQEDIVDEIIKAKPARSQFTLTAGLAANGGIGIAGGARPFTYRRISAVEA